jgi:predicted transcriptional regulator
LVAVSVKKYSQEQNVTNIKFDEINELVDNSRSLVASMDNDNVKGEFVTEFVFQIESLCRDVKFLVDNLNEVVIANAA